MVPIVGILSGTIFIISIKSTCSLYNFIALSLYTTAWEKTASPAEEGKSVYFLGVWRARDIHTSCRSSSRISRSLSNLLLLLFISSQLSLGAPHTREQIKEKMWLIEWERIKLMANVDEGVKYF